MLPGADVSPAVPPRARKSLRRSVLGERAGRHLRPGAPWKTTPSPIKAQIRQDAGDARDGFGPELSSESVQQVRFRFRRPAARLRPSLCPGRAGVSARRRPRASSGWAGVRPEGSAAPGGVLWRGQQTQSFGVNSRGSGFSDCGSALERTAWGEGLGCAGAGMPLGAVRLQSAGRAGKAYFKVFQVLVIEEKFLKSYTFCLFFFLK